MTNNPQSRYTFCLARPRAAYCETQTRLDATPVAVSAFSLTSPEIRQRNRPEEGKAGSTSFARVRRPANDSHNAVRPFGYSCRWFAFPRYFELRGSRPLLDPAEDGRIRKRDVRKRLTKKDTSLLPCASSIRSFEDSRHR